MDAGPELHSQSYRQQAIKSKIRLAQTSQIVGLMLMVREVVLVRSVSCSENNS